MKKALVLASLTLFLCGSLAAFETTKTLSLPVDGLQKIEIQAGAGSLTVSGREGLAAIEVRAEIIAKHVREEDMDSFLKDRIELTLEKRGGRAVLVSRVREKFRLFDFDGDAVINLTVSVPKTLPLDIDDGSGSIVAQDLASLRIDDGSGSIKVERIAGDLAIDDGSGSTEISDVQGNVSIDDGSGEITIRRVGGTVEVDDGSGGIEIDDVAHDVRLINAGSGGVDISNVRGRVIRD